MTRRPLSVSLCIVSLAAATLVAGCNSEASEQRDDRQIEPDPVETLVVSTTDFVDTFEVLGAAEADESVEISTQYPGEVLEAYVEEGDTVQQGDPLFRIDSESDQAGQQALEAEVEAAERELNRLENLREEGLATEQQVDNARTDLERARSNLRQSRSNLGRHRVTSPVDGRVADRMIDPGEVAGTGVPLVEVVDDTTITVDARVPETEIQHVDTDRQTEVDVDIPATGETFEGVVRRVSLRPSETTRTYRVEIEIDNQKRRIRPGMRARTHFRRRTYEDAVVIPRDAVLEGFEDREVMIVEGDDDTGRARVRTIEAGPGTRENLVVLSGLEAGERLILRGHRGLVGDTRVEVVEQSRQDGPEDQQ